MIRSISTFLVLLLILSGCSTNAVLFQGKRSLATPRATLRARPIGGGYHGLHSGSYLYDRLNVLGLHKHRNYGYAQLEDSAWFMVINKPGYYYIDANITLNCNGIYVNASNVVIDGGWHIISKGDPIKNFVGIYIADAENVTVMNIVLDWVNGEAIRVSSSLGIRIYNTSIFRAAMIYVNSSRGVLISDCVFSMCYILTIESSERVILKDNHIYFTSVGVMDSRNMELVGNSISQAYPFFPLYVLLYNSSGNIIRNNSLHMVGIMVRNSWNNTIADNYANGREIVYLENESDRRVVGNLGELILVGCDNISVENVSVSNTTLAVDIFKSTNVRLVGIELSENWLGVFVDGCGGVNIYEGKFFDHSIIYALASSKINITCNIFGFGADGLFVENSVGVSICKNTFREEACVNIFIKNSTGSVISSNIMHVGGISLYGSYNNNISSNILNHSGVGLTYSHNNHIYDNILLGRGLGLFSSFSNYIFNNTIANSPCGVELENSSRNFIFFNNFINNTKDIWIFTNSSDIWVSPRALPFRYKGRIGMGFLGNYWDRYNGTDRDGDGIGDEPYLNDTAPLISPTWNYVIADSDGDGVNDLKEIAFGTDPFVPNNEHEEVSHYGFIGEVVLIALAFLAIVVITKKHEKLKHR